MISFAFSQCIGSIPSFGDAWSFHCHAGSLMEATDGAMLVMTLKDAPSSCRGWAKGDHEKVQSYEKSTKRPITAQSTCGLG